uniref:Uncharacterized protein n=1 Tax=Anguilla anguilla TaxID=7936 RepID=A0A0E9WYS2_ANGAN
MCNCTVLLCSATVLYYSVLLYCAIVYILQYCTRVWTIVLCYSAVLQYCTKVCTIVSSSHLGSDVRVVFPGAVPFSFPFS